MGEIGSEFWDVPIGGQACQVFPPAAQWYISGRCALQAIIHELKRYKTVAMPSWCCDSMVKPFLNAGLEVCFYPVWFENGLKQIVRYDCDILFLMDYFGYSAPQNDLRNYRGIVIRDVTHSIFSATYDDADYYFGSLRKWCGVWTGGYAWTRNGNSHSLKPTSLDDHGYINLRKHAMEMKESYIRGEIADKDYLRLYAQAEDILDNINTVSAAERDMELSQKLDVEYIKTKRRANAGVLRKAFGEWLLFPEMKHTDCPMFVPVLVPDNKRNELRRYLIDHLIYCPIHWPLSEYHSLTEEEQYIYDNELSLICDQRYTVKDMHRIVETIRKFMEA